MRRLKKIDVNFISLVDKGANRKKLVFKREETGTLAFDKPLPIKKLDEDQKMVFCIVYSPDEIDSQGDTASADVIKDAAYNFMRCARTNNIDKQHDFIPDEGFVAESWIVKENEPVFPEEPAGSWAVGIKVENDVTWNLIKAGEITGLSMAGLAETEEIEKDSAGKIEKNSIENAGSALPINNQISLQRFDEIQNSLTLLKEENKSISSRLSLLEKEPPLSRQVKREDKPASEIIKIWT